MLKAMVQDLIHVRRAVQIKKQITCLVLNPNMKAITNK